MWAGSGRQLVEIEGRGMRLQDLGGLDTADDAARAGSRNLFGMDMHVVGQRVE